LLNDHESTHSIALVLGRAIGDMLDLFMPMVAVSVRFGTNELTNGCEIRPSVAADMPIIHIPRRANGLFTVARTLAYSSEHLFCKLIRCATSYEVHGHTVILQPHLRACACARTHTRTAGTDLSAIWTKEGFVSKLSCLEGFVQQEVENEVEKFDHEVLLETNKIALPLASLFLNNHESTHSVALVVGRAIGDVLDLFMPMVAVSPRFGTNELTNGCEIKPSVAADVPIIHIPRRANGLLITVARTPAYSSEQLFCKLIGCTSSYEACTPLAHEVASFLVAKQRKHTHSVALVGGRAIGDVLDLFMPMVAVSVRFGTNELTNGCEIKPSVAADVPIIHILRKANGLLITVARTPAYSSHQLFCNLVGCASSCEAHGHMITFRLPRLREVVVSKLSFLEGFIRQEVENELENFLVAKQRKHTHSVALVVGRALGDVLDLFMPMVAVSVRFGTNELTNGCGIKPSGAADMPIIHILRKANGLFTMARTPAYSSQQLFCNLVGCASSYEAHGHMVIF
ncbi:hypothetical protein EJB05_45097, partial [Eragrostis curvula]